MLNPLQQQAVAKLLEKQPRLGVGRLLQFLPGLPRNSTANYVRRWKQVRRKRCRRRWRKLHWHMPAAVWAIDGTLLDEPVASSGRRALVVVELCRRKTLGLKSVPGERAAAAEQVLDELIAQHGAPLVLKADNGPAFVAQRLRTFCAQRGITLMHSPVRRPRWNGTCEVSGRWAKTTAMAAACRRGSPAGLCQADLDCAVTFTGTMPRIDDALRERFVQLVARQVAAVRAERGLASDQPLHDHQRRSLERVAVQRALQMCHILTIEGRGYRQWLPAPAA